MPKKNKKLNAIDKHHHDKIVEMMMKYGHKNRIMPDRLKLIFEKMLETWVVLTPSKEVDGEADTNKQ